MIVLRIVDNDLPQGRTHDATDWQVAHDIEFKDIVVESLNDKDNKTTKIFNVALDPKKTYYARARALYNTGWSEWGNIEIFEPEDVDKEVYEISMPSLVGTPIVKTDYENLNHPLSNFKITTSEFGVYGNATHKATTWLITDIHGNIVYENQRDENNLTSIVITNVVLKPFETYKILVSHIGDNRDISQLGTYTINTGDNTDIVKVTNLNHSAWNSDLGFKVSLRNKQVKKVAYILAEENGKELVNDSVDSDLVIVRNNVVNKNIPHVLNLTITDSDDKVYKVAYRVNVKAGNLIFVSDAPYLNDCLKIYEDMILTSVDTQVNAFNFKDGKLLTETRKRIREISDNSIITDKTRAVLMPNNQIVLLTIKDSVLNSFVFGFNRIKFDIKFEYKLSFKIDNLDDDIKKAKIIAGDKLELTLNVNGDDKKYTLNVDTEELLQTEATDEESRYIKELKKLLEIEIPEQTECPN